MEHITGEQLRSARQVQDMTQEEASKLLGISRSYLSSIENDKVNPSDILREKIDMHFSNTLDQFFYVS